MNYRLRFPIAAVLIFMGVGALLPEGRARADTITTKSGLTFRNAKVSVIEGDGIRITYPGGTAKVLFEEMTPALKARYSSPAVKEVAAADRVQQENEARLKQAQEQQIRDQQEASTRFDEEERTRLEEARQLEKAQAAARYENLGKKSLKMLASIFYLGGIAIASFFVYFLPAFVARKKRKFRAIFVLNLVAGWTVVGWIAALILALTDTGRDAEIAA